MENNNKKVVLGLSGGVDSAAACLILKEQGYEVIGLYFNVLEGGCFKSRIKKGYSDEIIESEIDNDKKISEGLAKAQHTADQLGIRLIKVDASAEFDKQVVEYFCREYSSGRTPNPCVYCNPNVKFKLLTEAADKEGAQYIATGHYADTYKDEDGIWHIRKAANASKDQSYMLYRLGQETISRLLLPLNSINDKEHVRDLARKYALSNSETKDSQEICFIDNNDNYVQYMERRGIRFSPGNFIDKEGKVLGKHKGIVNYTLGQRKGLGITLGRPAFVTEINSEENTVTLGSNEDLFKREIYSDNNVFCRDLTEKELCKLNGGLTAKVRYAAREASVTIESFEDGIIKAVFDEPQRAATPGQSIVFYKDSLVIGGGFIK